MNRVQKDEAPALAGGKLLHRIFEDAGRGNVTLHEAAEIAIRDWKQSMSSASERDRLSGEKALKIIEDLGEGLALWEDKYPFEFPVLEIEEPFEIEFPDLPNVFFRGRPDRVGILNNQIWHVQNRGLAAGTNFGIYIATAKRHYHEHLYAEHLAWKWGLGLPDGFTMPDGEHFPKGFKYGGTMFNLVRKLKYRTKVTKANPAGETKTKDELFFQHPMSINLKSGLHKHVMFSMFQHVRAMQQVQKEWEEDQIIPAPNERLNAGPFGNMVDPFFRVLTGEITLEDNEVFKDREDTYAPQDALTVD